MARPAGFGREDSKGGAFERSDQPAGDVFSRLKWTARMYLLRRDGFCLVGDRDLHPATGNPDPRRPFRIAIAFALALALALGERDTLPHP